MSAPVSPPGPEPADRLARAALVRVSEPGDPRVAREVAAYGAVEAWRRVAALHPDVEPERELSVAMKAGLRLICPGDDEWPAGLDDLARPGPAAELARAARALGARAAEPGRGRPVRGGDRRIARGDELRVARGGRTRIRPRRAAVDGRLRRGATGLTRPRIAVRWWLRGRRSPSSPAALTSPTRAPTRRCSPASPPRGWWSARRRPVGCRCAAGSWCATG